MSSLRATKPAWVNVLRELGVELSDHQVRAIARIRRQMMTDARESALAELARYTINEPSIVKKSGALRKRRIESRFDPKAIIAKARQRRRKADQR